jgi:hypothetical protein
MPKTEPRPIPFPEKEKDDNKTHEGMPKFVRCDLNEELKSALKDWANDEDTEDLIDMICDCVSDGYVVSIKPMKDTGFLAAMTGMYGTVNNKGMCLTGRSSTPERAVWSLIFKHYVVLKKNWSTAPKEDNLDW